METFYRYSCSVHFRHFEDCPDLINAIVSFIVQNHALAVPIGLFSELTAKKQRLETKGKYSENSSKNKFSDKVSHFSDPRTIMFQKQNSSFFIVRMRNSGGNSTLGILSRCCRIIRIGLPAPVVLDISGFQKRAKVNGFEK